MWWNNMNQNIYNNMLLYIQTNSYNLLNKTYKIICVKCICIKYTIFIKLFNVYSFDSIKLLLRGTSTRNENFWFTEFTALLSFSPTAIGRKKKRIIGSSLEDCLSIPPSSNYFLHLAKNAFTFFIKIKFAKFCRG